MLSFKDLFLAPVYLIVIYFIVMAFGARFNKDRNLKKYFRWALLTRMFSTIAFSLIHGFYYGGDTGAYFNSAKQVWQAFLDNPMYAFKLIFDSKQLDPNLYKYTSMMYMDINGTEGIIVKIAAFIGLFSFHTYIVIAFVFSIFCFSGLWATYKVFYKLYPTLHKELAIAILFFPSAIFWGSGLLKDPLTMGALGWVFWGFYNAVVEKKRIIPSIIAISLGGIIIYNIKIYIILCFLPAALSWIFLEYNHKIKSPVVKGITLPIFLAFGAGFGYLALVQVSADDYRYSLDTMAKTAMITADYLRYMSEQQGGAYYSIGQLDGSFGSMLRVAPQAINVSLFRPYLWEARNPFILLAALESLVFLVLTIRAFLRNGIFKSLAILTQTPLLLFCLIFSLVFAFSIGVSTVNYGSLVRYKIPLYPFYLAAIFILLNYKKIKKPVLVKLRPALQTVR